MVSSDLLTELVSEARLSPSVHNIQPTRWRLDGNTVLLMDDERRRLPAADPTGRDVAISHGAALEGFALSLAKRGLDLVQVEPAPPGEVSGRCKPIVRLMIAARRPGAASASLAEVSALTTRISWRGRFQPTNPDAGAALERLAAVRDDLILARTADDIAFAADWADRAGFDFLCDDAHRAELLRWMRMSSRHPDIDRDGLSARAMALGGVEAFAAGLLLGPLFPMLKRIGLAAPLLSERAKTVSAAAIALLHRPDGEDPIVTGRSFHRAWLAMECEDLIGCPVSVLVDHPDAQSAVARRLHVPEGRRLVGAFRIGRPAGDPFRGRARLSPDQLIV
jgi:hypothetical protein